MGAANYSKARTAAAVAILLVSCSMLTCVDADPKSSWLCKLLCEVRCGGIPTATACILECVNRCLHDKSPANSCSTGCLMTSCLDIDGDPKSKRSCANSCSNHCEASYARGQNDRKCG